MYRIFAFFKVIDEKIFSAIGEFKQNEQYITINQKISNLDDAYQKLIRNTIFVFLFFLPIAVTFSTFYILYNKLDSISTKKEILQLIDHQLVLIKQVDQFSASLISNQSMSSEEDVKTSIASNPTLSGLNTKLSYENFTQTPMAGNLNANELSIKFSEISTPDLTSLIKFLFENYKARISHININRNEQRKLLQGELNIHVISN